jgi:orotate phosphoribosyltransferase
MAWMMPTSMDRKPVDRKLLAARIAEVSLLRGEFTLRSGRKSNYYLDKYRFETQGDILQSLGQLFAEHVTADVDRIAGAELGAVPLAAATSMFTGKPCVYVRNQKKEYGTAKQVEGVLNAGDKVLIVEDVLTTGGQVLEAAKVLESLGVSIVKIVAVIDREEGARQAIEGAGYRFDALFTTTDLGVKKQ